MRVSSILLVYFTMFCHLKGSKKVLKFTLLRDREVLSPAPLSPPPELQHGGGTQMLSLLPDPRSCFKTTAPPPPLLETDSFSLTLAAQHGAWNKPGSPGIHGLAKQALGLSCTGVSAEGTGVQVVSGSYKEACIPACALSNFR